MLSTKRLKTSSWRGEWETSLVVVQERSALLFDFSTKITMKVRTAGKKQWALRKVVSPAEVSETASKWQKLLRWLPSQLVFDFSSLDTSSEDTPENRAESSSFSSFRSNDVFFWADILTPSAHCSHCHLIVSCDFGEQYIRLGSAFPQLTWGLKTSTGLQISCVDEVKDLGTSTNLRMFLRCVLTSSSLRRGEVQN